MGKMAHWVKTLPFAIAIAKTFLANCKWCLGMRKVLVCYFCLLGNPFNICLEEYQSFLLFLLLGVLNAVSL